MHLRIWSILAILLPLGIISAWLVIPKPVTDKLLQPIQSKALPNILASAVKDAYTLRIRCNSDTSELQLEWSNKKTLTYPTATIYKTAKGNNDITKGALIGRIEARGDYYFKLDSAFTPINFSGNQLVLYDFIHQKIIDSITF